ncbi:MAG: hypothetical protein RI978_1125 [Verrucomicrobiota bacterium]|jgi:hypothetical protein
MNEVTRKSLLSIGGIILFIVVYGIALKVSDYTDTVSSRHADLAAARLDGVIERGWVPELLPAGSNDIWETHDLDTNTGGGGFQFPTNDLEVFKKQARQFAGAIVAEHPGNMVRIEYSQDGSRIELFLAPSPQANVMTGVWSMKPVR